MHQPMGTPQHLLWVHGYSLHLCGLGAEGGSSVMLPPERLWLWIKGADTFPLPVHATLHMTSEY